jgi:hypothetical protein
MRKLLILALAIGLSTQFYAQVINDGMLPEVEVRATNYKYLNSVDNSEAVVPIKLLRDMAAKFDVKSSEFYEDGNDFYRVYFFIPEGKIVAAYDRDGKILYTVEKFKDTALPHDVSSAVKERFPGWKIEKDVYRVNYHAEKGATQSYKVVLKNGSKTLRVKLNEEGQFL